MTGGIIAGAELGWFALTDKGRIRALNEDAVLAEPPLFVVADGMGGHDAGEVASALTVARMRSIADAAVGSPTSMDAVAAELRAVNYMLRDSSLPNQERGMGTTAVGIAMVEHGGVPTWLVFNIGDSRCYSFFEGGLTQVSRDHSYVQELVDAGELDPADAAGHAHRNVITRALGGDASTTADFWLRPVRPQERFLLCSDGLTNELDDPTIAWVLAHEEVPDAAGARLMELALAAGGRDNVSVVIVDVHSAPGLAEVSTHTKPGRTRKRKRRSRSAAEQSAAGTAPPPMIGEPPPGPPVAPMPTDHVSGDGETIELVPPRVSTRDSGGDDEHSGESPLAGLPEHLKPPELEQEEEVGDPPGLIVSLPQELAEAEPSEEELVGAEPDDVGEAVGSAEGESGRPDVVGEADDDS